MTLTVSNICGTNSATIDVDVNCIVGVAPAIASLEMALYPNPSTGLFRVEFDALLEDARLEVFDLAGRRVWSRHVENPQGAHTETVDLRDQAKGTYLVRLQVGNIVVNKRAVID